MRALVIDDSRAMRTYVRMVLDKAGFEIVEAGNGKEALQRLEENWPIDVAMVDWNMPICNGYEFVKEARANDAWNDMRIVMATTESEIDQIVKALDAGANEYLMKPFDQDAILDKLAIVGVKV